MEYLDSNRRSFLRTLGATGLMAALPETVLASGPERAGVAVETLQAEPEPKPKYSIKFAVCDA